MKLPTLPVTKLFHLNTDPDKLATITIRQCNNGDEKKIAKLTENQAYRNNSEGSRDLIVKWNNVEIVAAQVSCALCGATDIQDAEGKELFEFRAGSNGDEVVPSSFTTGWARLPVEVCDEIYECVLDLNPQWDNRPAKSAK